MSQVLPVKPLSVNEAYTGKRHRSKKYNVFKSEVAMRLKLVKLPPPPYEVHYTFAVSNKGFDWDNAIKSFQDVMTQRYNFNDNLIYKGVVIKKIVPKGKEYIEFNIMHYEED